MATADVDPPTEQQEDFSNVTSVVESRGDDVEEGKVKGDNQQAMVADPPPIRSMILVMLCMFQGYASMVGPLQSAFKHALGAAGHSEKAHVFTQAAVCVHYGKLLARLGHNVVLGFATPWLRVLISMAFMLVGVLVPPLVVFSLGSDWVGTVFIAYLLSGLGLGVFEVTFLSVITPLGKSTKAWTIVGAPAGFATINILGLMLTSFGVPVVWLYWYIVACLPVGIYIFYLKAPRGQAELKTVNFRSSLWSWRCWMPQMLPFFMAQFVSHFAMENWPSIFYMFRARMIPLFNPRGDDHLVNWDQFFAVTYVFIFLGDAISRRVAFYLNCPTTSRIYLYLGASVIGIIAGLALEGTAIAAIIPFAIFLVFWGNGTIYGLTAKYIDMDIPSAHNLASYSFWCFIGDLGAILGGVLVESTHQLFCVGHHGPYEC
mmetsp:Transcript_37487/g.67809  ORF Transcript_37487/g.67809 Transcript_37487/m.67809 type:complete len:430 (+) Transcript_37487:67-1356(+)